MSYQQKPTLIIFVTSVFDTPKTGPATFARLLHKFYKQDGVNFKIITSDCENPDQHIITVKKTYIKSFVYYRLWKKAKNVIKNFPENRIIIHYNNAFPYLYFGKLGNTTITQVNDYYATSPNLHRIKQLNRKNHIRYYLQYFFESRSLNKSDIIIFNSIFTRDFLLKAYDINSTKCKVIYKSIDPSKLSKNIKNTCSGTILFIGNNFYLKGLDILIEASAFMPSVKTIYIAGPPKLDHYIMKKINSLSSKIEFKLIGSLKQSDLYELMRKSDILVIPARAESLGVSVIEALAQGIPVITSGEGGLQEVLNGYPTICADNQNLIPEYLGKSVTKMLSEYPIYKNIFLTKREKIIEIFSVKKMIEALYNTYEL